MAIINRESRQIAKAGKSQNQFGRIGVLMGGPSTEREISLKSGKAVFENLKQLGLDVVALDIRTADPEENIKFLKAHKIDCAFIALHGRFGEDGQVQEILDTLKIPYTGSGKLASRLAMDKIASRRILEVYGLAVPRYKVVHKLSYRSYLKSSNGFIFPAVVKPATHGSSIGLTIIDKKEDLENALETAFNFDEHALIEEYIGGREVTVGILDNRPLPVIEIVPRGRFFDYEAKYTAGLTDYIVPAKLEQSVARKIQSVALRVHQLLGCSGFSRADMILSEKNIPFVLELNTIPGFTRTSLFPKAARVLGIEFGQLCLELIRLAYGKT